MATLTASGLGSGLDVRGLVSQLVSAERTPVSNRLDLQEAQVQAKISGFGGLRSALAQFEGAVERLTDLDDFLARRASSSDPDVFTASATSEAVAGSYDVQVERLARSHKLISTGFASRDSEVGTGSLTITLGGESMTVDVASDGNTLERIRDAINGASGNPGVDAGLITVFDDALGASVSKLVLTARETGEASAITVTVQDNDTGVENPDGDTDMEGLSRLAYDAGAGVTNLDEVRAAADALLWIDGEKVTSSTNTVEGAIEGVTLTLKTTSDEGDLGALVPATLEVAVDPGAARGLVQGFVTAYNTLRDAIAQLDSYNAATGQASVLFGDSAVRGLGLGLRRALSDPVAGLTGAYTSLAAIGVTTGADGKLAIDATRLDAALSADLPGIANLFASSEGLGQRFTDLVAAYGDPAGILEARTDGLDRRVEDITAQRETLARRMESLEARLLKQFTAMDELVARLQSTSSFLTQQLASLQSITGGGNGT
jgi:flagellar hook-associated protein 2